MLAGRDLTWAEIYNQRPVALVSENTAREMWGSPQAAIGKRIRVNLKDDWREVIGVVGDEHTDGVDKKAPTIVYWPLFQKNFEAGPVNVQRYICLCDSYTARWLDPPSERIAQRYLEHKR